MDSTDFKQRSKEMTEYITEYLQVRRNTILHSKVLMTDPVIEFLSGYSIGVEYLQCCP